MIPTIPGPVFNTYPCNALPYAQTVTVAVDEYQRQIPSGSTRAAVESFPKSFINHDLTIGYTQYRGEGHPPPELGAPGDMYIDIASPKRLFVRFSWWHEWPGLAGLGVGSLIHPSDSTRVAWCGPNDISWRKSTGISTSVRRLLAAKSSTALDLTPNGLINAYLDSERRKIPSKRKGDHANPSRKHIKQSGQTYPRAPSSDYLRHDEGEGQQAPGAYESLNINGPSVSAPNILPNQTVIEPPPRTVPHHGIEERIEQSLDRGISDLWIPRSDIERDKGISMSPELVSQSREPPPTAPLGVPILASSEPCSPAHRQGGYSSLIPSMSLAGIQVSGPLGVHFTVPSPTYRSSDGIPFS